MMGSQAAYDARVKQGELICNWPTLLVVVAVSLICSSAWATPTAEQQAATYLRRAGFDASKIKRVQINLPGRRVTRLFVPVTEQSKTHFLGTFNEKTNHLVYHGTPTNYYHHLAFLGSQLYRGERAENVQPKIFGSPDDGGPLYSGQVAMTKLGTKGAYFIPMKLATPQIEKMFCFIDTYHSSDSRHYNQLQMKRDFPWEFNGKSDTVPEGCMAWLMRGRIGPTPQQLKTNYQNTLGDSATHESALRQSRWLVLRNIWRPRWV